MASSQQLKALAHNVIEAYNSWSLPAILAFRTPNCTHKVLPTSLKAKLQTNDQYSADFGARMPLIQDFHLKVDPGSMVVDTDAMKVSFFATSTGNTAVGPYANEYIWMLYCAVVDGEVKVEKMKEFGDSKRMEEFWGSVEEHGGLEKVLREQGEVGKP